MNQLHSHRIFRSEHYAGTFVDKIQRSFDLGPRYFLRDVPRYWSERRRGAPVLSPMDLEVLWNPLHEFGLLKNAPVATPPGLEAVMDKLSATGLTIALKPERFLAVCSQWWHAAQGDATVIECGAYRGATGLAIALLGLNHGFNQDVHLFDLFGTPCEFDASPVDGAQGTNRFAMEPSYPQTLRAYTQTLGIASRVHIHTGLFSDTFPNYISGKHPCKFAHIDANIYASTKQACNFVKPMLAEDAVVVFDDYHGITDLGARLAIDQSFGRAHGRIRRLSGTSAVLSYRK